MTASVRPASASADGHAVDQLELELRRLPGVSGVGFTDEDDILVIHVYADVGRAGGQAELRHQVVQQARALVDRTLAVDVRDAGEPPPADRGRVQLVSVRVEHFSQEMEVHLSHRGVHTVGRAPAGSPEGAVDATLKALTDLGAALPFRVEAAAAPVAGAAHAVIVILEPEDEIGTRYGVARGTTIEEAAARATLHALNRYLSRLPALSPAS
ncbi:MAG TPA: hypothetical protein VFA94_16225 [Acidimicrobiales bacterium]|nr:hypothetical protein [Acidimicrobiales bacterium]